MKSLIYVVAICFFTGPSFAHEEVVECLKALLQNRIDDGEQYDIPVALATRSEDYVNRLARYRALASLAKGQFDPEQLLLNPALLTVPFPQETEISADYADPFYSDIQRAIDVAAARQIAEEIDSPYSGPEFVRQLEAGEFEGQVSSPGIVLSFQMPQEAQPRTIQYLKDDTFEDMARLLILDPGVQQALPTPEFVQIATRIKSPQVVEQNVLPQMGASFSDLFCIGVVYSHEGHSSRFWQFNRVFEFFLSHALEHSYTNEVRVHFPQALSFRYNANWTKETASLKDDLEAREKMPSKEAFLRTLLNDLSEASAGELFERLEADHPVEWDNAGGAVISTANTAGDREIQFVFE